MQLISVFKINYIDSGVNYNHEDLRDNIWHNTAEVNGKAGVDDGHAVCSILSDLVSEISPNIKYIAPMYCQYQLYFKCCY